MGEALLIKSGGGSAGGSANSSQNIASNGLITEIFTSNTLWRVPENLRDRQITYRIFGGGSAGNMLGGGCGGFMKNGVLTLKTASNLPINEVYITIGSGGRYINGLAGSGGPTSIGSLAIANGATIYNGGSGGGGLILSGRNGYQFGGGGAAGSGEWSQNGNIPYDRNNANFQGGHGGQWGGGGGSQKGLAGGIGGCVNGNTSNISGYGGNGGNHYVKAEDGTNTYGISGLEFKGLGKAGNSNVSSSATLYVYGGAGGGGYGGNGGNGGGNGNTTYSKEPSCGGGGGYGAKGGDGSKSIYSIIHGGGGGGGYGGNGGYGGVFRAGGGGGYGQYGVGGSSGTPAGIAAGGYGCLHNSTNNYHHNFVESCAHGGDGICIIQYYLD